MTRNRVTSLEKYALPLWFTANLFVGVFIVHDFGISFDEWSYYIYAKNSVDAYTSFFSIGHIPVLGPSFMPYYGPAFVIIPELIVRLIKLISPDVFAPDIWHFSYFVVFLTGGLCLFSIAGRWFNRWSAWSILLLYNFQPILWGHAFINPKDVPFMAFFLLTLWSGLRLADSFGNTDMVLFFRPMITQHWQSIEEDKRFRFLKLIKIETRVFLIVAALTIPLHLFIKNLVLFLLTLDPYSFLGRLSQSIALHATDKSINNYVIKVQILLLKMEISLFFMAVLLTIAYYSWISLSGKNTWQRRANTKWINQSLTLTSREFLSFLRNPKVLLAGILLGLTISIRVLGPLAGLIVIAYLALMIWQRSISVILAYLFYAGLTTYITWPYLWSNPIGHFIESMVVMSSYPWTGRVLFNGQLYRPDQLPASYLPVLLNVQLTEPLIALIYLGSILLILILLRKQVRIDLLLVLIMGAFLPIMGLIIFRVTMYDNFRQIIFVIPQLLLVTGIALDVIFSAIRQPVIRFVLMIALVFPGINAIVHLHPYEYVYYNSFIGGTNGAFRKFELDYWATSYREAAEWLNANAPSGAKIWADDPGDLLEFYLQSDLNLHPNSNENAVHYDYVVSTTRYNNDLNLYPQAKFVYLIQRADAVLAVIKKP
jgi:hypothetical protein